MTEMIDGIWALIKEHEDDKDGTGACVIGVLHLILGIIASILVGVFTPLHFWVIASFVLSFILFVIWMAAPKGNLAVGYFFAMSFFSLAWLIYLPIIGLICLLCLPIIINEFKHKDELKKNKK
jgi:hypothetical protein